MTVEHPGANPDPNELSNLKLDLLFASINITDALGEFRDFQGKPRRLAVWDDECMVGDRCWLESEGTMADCIGGHRMKFMYWLTVCPRDPDGEIKRYRYDTWGCYIEQCDESWEQPESDEGKDHTLEVLEILRAAPLPSPIEKLDEKYRQAAADIMTGHAIERRYFGRRTLKAVFGEKWAYRSMVKYIQRNDPILSEEDIAAAFDRQSEG